MRCCKPCRSNVLKISDRSDPEKFIHVALDTGSDRPETIIMRSDNSDEAAIRAERLRGALRLSCATDYHVLPSVAGMRGGTGAIIRSDLRHGTAYSHRADIKNELLVKF